MPAQDQFLDVIDRDEAERRFHAALRLQPLAAEAVALATALGRVLADDVRSPVDVPSFDRSNVDGYAIQAADSFGASETQPKRLKLLAESIATAVVPRSRVAGGQAVEIATGGMVPRGANAVVMVEHTDIEGETLFVRRAVTPGANISFAGTDITAGELVLHRGEVLTSRETGVLAAVGIGQVSVVRRPRERGLQSPSRTEERVGALLPSPRGGRGRVDAGCRQGAAAPEILAYHQLEGLGRAARREQYVHRALSHEGARVGHVAPSLVPTPPS
jgi:hypothetical protein